jgi:hypothetical protein
MAVPVAVGAETAVAVEGALLLMVWSRMQSSVPGLLSAPTQSP